MNYLQRAENKGGGRPRLRAPPSPWWHFVARPPLSLISRALTRFSRQFITFSTLRFRPVYLLSVAYMERYPGNRCSRYLRGCACLSIVFTIMEYENTQCQPLRENTEFGNKLSRFSSVCYFYVYNFCRVSCTFTSCYVERPQPELPINVADKSFLSVGLWELLSNRMVWIINDDRWSWK